MNIAYERRVSGTTLRPSHPVQDSLLIIVPARGGSRRLPGKNRKLLAGKPLLDYTADAVVKAKLKAPVLLTTDDDGIAADGERLGWLVPFRRPAALAGGDAPTADAVVHALDWFRADRGGDPDAVMVLQPTSPLRGSACLISAIDILATRPDVDSVVAMTALHLPAKHFYLCGVDGTAAPLSASDRKPVFVPNGALYLTRTAKLRAAHSLYAGLICPLVMNAERSVDIDTEADWRLAESILSRGLPPENVDIAAPVSVGSC